MNGRCYNCAKSFGFFSRSHECALCRKLFCSSCTSNKVNLPERDRKKRRVCDICQKSRPQTSSKQTEGATKQADTVDKDSQPPESIRVPVPGDDRERAAEIQRKIDEKRNCQTSRDVPKHLSTEQVTVSDSSSDLQELSERLKRLKDNSSDGHVPDIDEIGERLAALKGTECGSEENSSNEVLKPQPWKSQFEQAEDLMKQVKDETALDQGKQATDEMQEKLSGEQMQTPGVEKSEGSSGAKKENEIESLMKWAQNAVDEDLEREKQEEALRGRLVALQQTGSEGNDLDQSNKMGSNAINISHAVPAGIHADSGTEDEEAAKLIQQITEEIKLDKNLEERGLDKLPSRAKSDSPFGYPPSAPSMEEFNDQLPWCCICNDDATIRCHDCDDDLYCKRCFREGHAEFSLKSHRHSRFQKAY